MANKRSGRGKGNTAVAETPQVDNANNGASNTTNGERKMAGLTPEQIQQLLGKTRTKGQYTEYINAFIASGEAGVCANEEWAALTSKKASTLKQGFENAKDKKDVAEGAANVKVIVNEDKVYLINLAADGVQAPQATTAEPAANAAV